MKQVQVQENMHQELYLPRKAFTASTPKKKNLMRAIWEVREHMSVLHFNLADIAENYVLGGKVKTLLTPEKLGKDNPSQKFAHSEFKPGEGLRAHLHPESSEIYFVVKGGGTVFLGENLSDKKIKAGDILFIPPRTIHGVKNTGKESLEIAFFLVPGTESSKEV